MIAGLAVLACAPEADDPHPLGVVTQPPPFTSTASPFEPSGWEPPPECEPVTAQPVWLSLVVAPLVSGEATTFTIAGASPGGAVQVWTGSSGGTSCPPELAGGCLPIGDAVILVSGVADAAGRVVVQWTVEPSEPVGTYPAFVATVDTGLTTLPVMRRIWADALELSVGEPIDAFDVPGSNWLYDDPAVPIGPGDWMDLGLDSSDDDYEVSALGNQRLMAAAVFDRGLGDVWYGLSAPAASETALVCSGVNDVDPYTWQFEGISLATGAWTLGLISEYGDHRGTYDLVIRLITPEEDRTWYADADKDTWGDTDLPTEAPIAPEGMVYRGDDCHDADPLLHPEAWDVCEDGVDDDCSGTDKPCHHAPVGDGLMATFVQTHAELGMSTPFDVAGMGDANGDGVPEVWIRNNARVSVLEGVPGTRVTLELLKNDHGWGWSRTGDFDHDGTADIAWGGAQIEPEGAVWIAQVPVDPTTVESQAWATLVGTVDVGNAGQYLDTSGDLDGDGWADLLVGSSAANTVWWIPSVVPGRRDLDVAAESVITASGVPSGAGDYDGDGLSDLAVGTLDTTAYIALSPLPGALDLASDADTTITFPNRLVQELSIGDTDGDGSDELLLTSWEAAKGWLFESPPAGALIASSADTVITVSSATVDQHAIGDLDGDGHDDVALADPLFEVRGLVSVVYGPLAATLQVPLEADLVLRPLEHEAIGRDVWFVDADADGGDDLVFGTNTFTMDVLFGVP